MAKRTSSHTLVGVSPFPSFLKMIIEQYVESVYHCS